MIIGLTGGIAMGKSNVSHYLAERGFPIIDADKITHQVQAKGSDGLKAIVDRFGKSYLNPDLTLNRVKLGQLVFNNHKALNSLVRTIDPYIRKEVIHQIDEGLKKKDRVVLDAPTLFENGYQYLVDQVWVVVCDPIIEMNRLRKRDHLSISDAESRINSQWPITIKETLANRIINSDGSKAQTINQVKRLIDSLIS